VWEPSQGGRVLLVGGGSGVAPLMTMARARARAASTVPMRWLSSSRTLADVMYRAELEGLAAAGDGFELFQTLTRGAPEGWAGYQGRIDERIALDALAMLEVDELGLDTIDRRILRTIVEKYEGGPVGLDTIAVSVSEDPETVEDVYEPFLMQLGFLARTPRGRVATKLAYDHLGLVKASSGEQPRLF